MNPTVTDATGTPAQPIAPPALLIDSHGTVAGSVAFAGVIAQLLISVLGVLLVTSEYGTPITSPGVERVIVSTGVYLTLVGLLARRLAG